MNPRTDKSPSSVPRLLLDILDRFCDDELAEEFIGDLEELHSERLRSSGSMYANARTTLDVISFLRARFKKQRMPGRERYNGMLASSYARIAWRGVLKNRSYAFMNVVGLATGLACCLLIGIYIQDELSYDTYHAGAEDLYRVTSAETVSGRLVGRASTHVPLAPTLSDEYAAVRSATRIYPYSALVSRSTNVQYQEDGLIFADSTFFDLFTFEQRAGWLETALDDPFSIVLTESAAQRYFGTEDAIGQPLNVQIQRGSADFTVTAVVEDVPANSHFSFDIVASFQSMRTLADHIYNWHSPPVYTYVALSPGTDAASLEAKFPAFRDKYLSPQGLDRSYVLQPIQDIHLRSRLENEISATGDIRYIYVFSIIAGLILLIGSINYMNLSTARSAARAREIGMRRVLGAKRGQLAIQFLSESMVTSGIALITGLVMARLLLQPFNNLTGKELAFANIFSGWNPALLIGLFLVIGLLTGAYPAFFMSSNQSTWIELNVSMVEIDKNGNLLFRGSGYPIRTFGYLAWERVCELLPFDYDPFEHD